jgi:diguanylate cyclase (GGDEF)-like protein
VAKEGARSVDDRKAMTDTRAEIVNQVLSAVPVALAYVAGDGSVLYENGRMTRLARDVRDGALRRSAAARVPGSTGVDIVEGDGDDARIWRFEFHPAGADGMVIVGTDITATRRMEGQLEELLAYEQSARAITEEEKAHLAQEKVLLEQVASTDTLTGLSNRRAFADTLERELAEGAAAGTAAAVLYIDLDGFKTINDTLGHAAGDELLVQVAYRLRGCIRGGDVAARLGGDEFVLLLAQLPPDAAEQATARVAERALSVLCDPIELDGGTHRVSGSMGLTIAQPGTIDSERLLAAADAAMYEAKRDGGNRIVTVANGLRDAA